MIMGRMSFVMSNGLNLILSVLVFLVVGFEEPLSWREIRWNNTIMVISIGRRKCREKNRFSVGCDTDGPPQIQITSSDPTSGMADRTPVITVAPQNDICPHGRTYPRNAVAIVSSIRVIPVAHTFGMLFGDEK